MAEENESEEVVDLSAEIENAHEGTGIDINEGQVPQSEPEPEQEEQQEESFALPEDDENIPEKFRGKSVTDVLQSYRELEKELGRKNNELGQLRKETDSELLQKLQEMQSVSDNSSQEEELSDDEFFENPREAVNKALKQSDVAKQIEELSTALREQSISKKEAEFKEKHPDFADVVQDPNFQSWVSESPVRQQMFREADQYDFDKANELLDIYKALNKGQQKEKGLSDQDVAAVQEAGLERGNSQKNSKKIYSSRQIIDLKKKNPKKYKQMLPEFKQAYAEGRVKA